jgi:hypothetical protein
MPPRATAGSLLRNHGRDTRGSTRLCASRACPIHHRSRKDHDNTVEPVRVTRVRATKGSTAPPFRSATAGLWSGIQERIYQHLALGGSLPQGFERSR